MEATSSTADPLSASPTTADADVLRAAFGCLPSGVAAVCAGGDGAPTGMLVSSLTSVSLDPPLLSFCVQDRSRTWARLRTSHRVGVSFLGVVHEPACADFARPADERLVDVATRQIGDCAAVLEGAPAVFVCAVQDEIPAGDHSIVLLRIVHLEFASDIAPLVFHRSTYHRLAR
ncbi:MAG: flavin reductase [Gordonia polyisoprenivorans]|nr:flavin reductase [Gordonia polyisoprenivorans]